MEITYFGHSSFKITSKKTTVVTDPFDASVGFTLPKVRADIITVSHQHHDHNFVQGVAGEPFVISAPGEYEIKEIDILGLPTFHDASGGRDRGENIIYQITAEGINILHGGDLGHQLSSHTLDDLARVDVLLVPVGGEFTIGPKEAEALVNAVEPKIVIPMHFRTEDHHPETFAKLKEVESFLEEMEVEGERLSSLKLTKSDLPEETRVIVLERNG